MNIRRINEENPCQDGWVMLGTKMKNGQEVPNCVPEDDVENYEEMTTTANAAGYQTPYAFSGNGDDAVERKREYLQRLNDRHGYTVVDDVLSEQGLQDFKNWILPLAKQSKPIRESLKRFIDVSKSRLNEASSNLINRAVDLYEGFTISDERFILELEKRLGAAELFSSLEFIDRMYDLNVDVQRGKGAYYSADEIRRLLGDDAYVLEMLQSLSNSVLEPIVDSIERDYGVDFL